MGKTIILQREELSWVSRTNWFDEEKWNKVKATYEKSSTESIYTSYIYNKIKDISWDEAYAAWYRYHYDEETEDELIIVNADEYRKQTLGSFVEEMIMEDNISQEIDYIDFADNSHETWEVK